MTYDVWRYVAFSVDPDAGNPAGVVIDTEGLDEATMQHTAAEVGYSETAFLRPTGDREYAVRYFSPQAEVPFCGHATIASAVAVAERDGLGLLHFDTGVGRINVDTARDAAGHVTATLTSVPTSVSELDDADLAELLAALGWSAADLDPAFPVRVGYAGAYHPVLVVGERERLADLDYDFDRLRDLMLLRSWTTIQLAWRRGELEFDVRNPFPVGGVVEDPATGAAAAAFGGYLRAMGLVSGPATVRLNQGGDMGRPSLLLVDIPGDSAEHRSRGAHISETVRVTGNAVVLTAVS